MNTLSIPIRWALTFGIIHTLSWLVAAICMGLYIVNDDPSFQKRLTDTTLWACLTMVLSFAGIIISLTVWVWS